jgi:pimeloyl-ACP methyl ester carboxylesterase
MYILPRIPGAKIKVIRDSGHLLPIDQPIQVADAIRNFVFALGSLNVSLASPS